MVAEMQSSSGQYAQPDPSAYEYLLQGMLTPGFEPQGPLFEPAKLQSQAAHGVILWHSEYLDQ